MIFGGSRCASSNTLPLLLQTAKWVIVWLLIVVHCNATATPTSGTDQRIKQAPCPVHLLAHNICFLLQTDSSTSITTASTRATISYEKFD